MDKRFGYLVVAAILAVVAIGLYGRYRCNHPEYTDIFMAQSGVWDLDGWSGLHFVFFGMLGALCGTAYLPHAMVLGVAWEGVEHVLGTQRPSWLGGFGDCVLTDRPPDQARAPGRTGDDTPDDKKSLGTWWYGRASDIVVNVAGYLAGMCVATT